MKRNKKYHIITGLDMESIVDEANENGYTIVSVVFDSDCDDIFKRYVAVVY